MQSFIPSTFKELHSALSQMTPHSRIVAGGTDYVIQARSLSFQPDALLYLGNIPELHMVSVSEEELRIGAMVTMEELSHALSAYPEFLAIVDACQNVGSVQVRNKATIVGNLCNASPAGDMLPIAKLYEARLEIFHFDGKYTYISIDDFILGPNKTALTSQQVVTALVINRKKCNGFISAFRKIGFRDLVSIARVSFGAMMKLSPDGVIESVRFALGAVSDTPIRVPEAEQLMTNRAFCDSMCEDISSLISEAVHDSCRPANRLYKTVATRGLAADVFSALRSRV